MTGRHKTFHKGQHVEVTNCIAFSGGPTWQGFVGVVRKVDSDGWVHVLLDEKPDFGVIPFRVRELSVQ